MKVSVFIVGAPKSGTTSLHYYLNNHPEVLMSSLKEPDYFSNKEIMDQKLYYKDPNINTLNEYHNLFLDRKDERLLGESSVSYLFYPEVSSRIKKYNKNAKIIIMIRNPIERALSHYLMDFRLGFIGEKFQDIFNLQKGAHFQQYFLLGNYYPQIKRYIDKFGKTNVHIIKYSDFKKQSKEEVRKVFKFIGVDSEVKVNIENIYNSSFIARNLIIRKLYSISYLRSLFSVLFSPKLIKLIRTVFFKKPDKPKLESPFLRLISEYYLKDIGKLEELLSIDLSEWKK